MYGGNKGQLFQTNDTRVRSHMSYTLHVVGLECEMGQDGFTLFISTGIIAKRF